MPIIPPGFAFCQAEYVHTGTARHAMTTFGIDVASGTTDPDQVAEEVYVAYWTATAVRLITDSGVSQLIMNVAIGQDGSDPLVGTFTDAIPGGVAQDSVPSNCAVLVHKRTARGGRRGRGRMYLPWAAPDNQVDDVGNLTVGHQSDVSDSLEVFRTALGLVGHSLVLLHSTGLSVTGPPDPVTALVVDAKIATQRRRLGR